MKLFDALKASPSDAAQRKTEDGLGREGREANVVIKGGDLFKAFRAVEDIAWERRRLTEAKLLDGWEPVETLESLRPWIGEDR